MEGKTLGNRYEIIEKIGDGGMAVVYKAKCHLLNRFVAIKILKDEFIDDEDFNRKFKRESQAAASLSHPNILNIFDVGVEEYNNKKHPYIVMEFIKGKTLKQVIKVRGKLGIDEAIYYSLQIAEAIKDAHINNIIHRDIKPQNIMVTDDNRIKVMDFGIARAATSSTMTTKSNVLGSVHYFSPEQARGGYTDQRSDIYSFGIVLYEMITGNVPYDGENLISVALKHVQEKIVPPREINRIIPVELEQIILKCVEKNQADRYSDISSVIRDLKNLGIVDGEKNPIEETSEDFQTKLLPRVIDTDNVDNNKAKKLTDDSNSKSEKKKNIKLSILAVSLALLLVISIFYGIIRLKDLLNVEEIIVPNLIGMDYKEAQDELERLGLKFNIKSYVKNNDYESGQITYQSVAESTKVKRGYTIEVTVNEEQDLIKVPSLINSTLEEAKIILGSLGFIVGNVTPKYSEITPVDAIMKQEPEANTPLEKGSKIHLVISKGEEVKKILMPNLINENIIDAKNSILALGLTIGEVVPQSSENIIKDRVIWQSHEAGTELDSKTAVNLYVSTGPKEKDGSDSDKQDNGKENRSIIIVIPIPESTDKSQIKVEVVKNPDNKAEKVYKKEHNTNEADISVKATGTTGDEFRVYFDGVEQSELTKKIEE